MAEVNSFNDINAVVGDTYQDYILKSLTPRIWGSKDSNIYQNINVIPSDFDWQNIPSGYDNSTWLIRDVHDLQGANVTLPQNVTLRFEGGRITNKGYLYINNTSIEANSKALIFDTTGFFSGTFSDVDVHPEWFGAKANGVDNDLPFINYTLFSPAKRIVFSEGVYVGGIDNNVSDRTLIFKEGCIIDGVVHVAIGTGNDINYNGTNIEWVRNTRVVGTLTTTVRVGSYYCDGVTIDKIRVTDINPSYINQTANGGSAGVHLYTASKNMTIGEISIESTTIGSAALGIDTGATVDADHKPENISIGKVIVNNNTQVGIVTKNTINTRIKDIVVNSSGINSPVIYNINDEGLVFDNTFVDGTISDPNTDSVYVFGTSNVTYRSVRVLNSKSIGFRSGVNTTTVLGDLYVDGADLEGVRIDGALTAQNIYIKNTPTGFCTKQISGVVNVGYLKVENSSVNNIVIDSNKTRINNIISSDCVGFGIYITPNSTGFYNSYIESFNNSQGIRCLSPNLTLGIAKLYDNTYGFIGSGMDYFSYEDIYFNNNSTYDTNTNFETLPNFRGKLSKAETLATLQAKRPLKTVQGISVDGSGNIGRQDFNHITSGAELETLFPPSSGIITLTGNVEYEGDIITSNQVDLNGFYLIGKNAFNDKHIYTGTSDAIIGDDSGTIKLVTLVASAIGSRLFNLDTALPNKTVLIRDVIVANCQDIGIIKGYDIVAIDVVNPVLNTGGITFEDITSLYILNINWSASNSGTFETYIGDFGVIQNIGGQYDVMSGSTGIDISGVTSLNSGELLSSPFNGDGTFITGIPSVDWLINCEGIDLVGDQFSTASLSYDNGVTDTTLSQDVWSDFVMTGAVLGASTTHRFEQLAGYPDALTYIGKHDVVKKITATFGLRRIGSGSNTYQMRIVVDGTQIGGVKQFELSGVDGSVTMALSYKFQTGDSVWAEIRNITDNDDIRLLTAQITI